MILLAWSSFRMINFTPYGKAMNYWQKKLLTFFIIRNIRWLIQNLHIGTLLLFHLISQIFHLFLLKAPLLILSTLYSPWSFLVTLISQIKSLLPSLFWSPIILAFYWELLLLKILVFLLAYTSLVLHLLR